MMIKKRRIEVTVRRLRGEVEINNLVMALIGLFVIAVFIGVIPFSALAEEPLKTVSVGTVGGLTDAGIFIGLEKGYFKEQGINIDYKVFGSSSDFMPLIGAGQLDVAGIVIAAGLFNSIANDIKLRIVGDKQSILKGFTSTVAVVRKDLVDSGKYKTPTDLKGLRFAVSALPSGTWYTYVEWARAKGIKESEIQWVELGFPQMAPSYRSKSIDAGSLFEPFLTQCLDQGLVTVVGDSYEVTPGATIVPIVYSEPFATQKKDLANKFMVAYMKGVRDYNDAYRKDKNRAETTKILANAVKMDPVLVERMRKGGLDPDQKVNKKWIITLQDFLFNHKYVPKKVDIDKIVDPSFVEYAIKQLGGQYRY